MNISQHAFVPLCQYATDNHVINGAGSQVAQIVRSLRVAYPFSPLSYLDSSRINSMLIFSTPLSSYYAHSYYPNPTLPYGRAVAPFTASGLSEFLGKPLVRPQSLVNAMLSGAKYFFTSTDDIGNNHVLAVYWCEKAHVSISKKRISFDYYTPDLI